MTTFDDRESAFENKFARDAELEFLAEASRDKALAYWAAELLGKNTSEAAKYAKKIIRADLESADVGIVDLLKKDLEGVADEETIRVKMAEYMEVARKRLLGTE